MTIKLMAVILAFSVLSAVPRLVFAQEYPTLAVLELATKDVSRETMLQYIDLVAGALFRTGSFTVVDGGRRDSALREIEFSASAAADRESQLEVGRMLAASYVVAGSLGVYDGKVVASLRAVETVTGKVAGSSDEVYDGMDELFEEAESLALATVRPFRKLGVARAGEAAVAAFESAAAGVPAPAFSPLQISIFAPLQMVPEKTPIYGLRVGLGYARNQSIIGIDIGLVNRVDGEAWGIQTALVNLAGGTLGIQSGLVGIADVARIFQANAIFNGADTALGLQVGLVNVAEKCIGLQVGLVNVAGILKGVQLGLANVVRYGEWAGFMPLVNVRF
ncbi:MAG: CsgG/HfaB family protein [Spirochaetaceae bacterium]|nr:CsgG/HfaB family protein [Spirochaetaceae bacterium]